MKHIVVCSLLLLSFSTVVRANGPECAKLFLERDGMIAAVSQAFHVDSLDSEIPVLKSRANFLRKRGLLEIVKNQNLHQVQLKNVRPFLLELKKHLEEIQIFSMTKLKLRGLRNIIELRGKIRNVLKITNQMQRQDDQSLVDIAELSGLGYQSSEIFSKAEEIKITPWPYDPKGFKGLIKLEEAIPIFGAPHPETMLYLISRGVNIWELSLESRIVDGLPILRNSEFLAIHDGLHIKSILGANRENPVMRRSQFFDRLWNGFINLEGQTKRERELSIFLIFDAFFEETFPMSLEGLKAYLSQPYNLYDRSSDSSLITRLTRPNDISSNIFQDFPVTINEIEKIATQLQAWVTNEVNK